MSGIHNAAAKGFQIGADAYERGRPEYPIEAVRRLVDELQLTPGKLVIDLGAGTGKFTKLLSTTTAAKIVAVEPVDGMRRKFSAVLPSVEIYEGSAEQIPFPNDGIDAVIAAQAFHWFDGAKALREIHRALRPGGYLGLIWNARDEAKPWVAKLTEIIDPHEGGAPRYKSGKWRDAFRTGNLFTQLKQAEYLYTQNGTHETVVDRVASISFISALPNDDKERVLNEVRSRLRSDSETKDQASIEFPYRTDVFWCQKVRSN